MWLRGPGGSRKSARLPWGREGNKRIGADWRGNGRGGHWLLLAKYQVAANGLVLPPLGPHIFPTHRASFTGKCAKGDSGEFQTLEWQTRNALLEIRGQPDSWAVFHRKVEPLQRVFDAFVALTVMDDANIAANDPEPRRRNANRELTLHPQQVLQPGPHGQLSLCDATVYRLPSRMCPDSFLLCDMD